MKTLLQVLILLLFTIVMLCVGLGVVFTRVISPQQTPDLIRRVYEAAHFNSTAAAMQQAAAPYLVQVFNAVLGGKEPEAVLRAGVTDSSHLLPAYANKMAQVYFLPARAAIPLCRGLLCVISVAWFCLYVIGIVLWKYYPHILLRTTQKQQQGKEQ